MKAKYIIYLIGLASIFFTGLAKAQDRPNILWITLEDTSPQFMGSYGNKLVKTPVMDKLANEGVRFTSAFSTGTVCAPSRSTIITGCRTEVLGTANHRSSFPVPEFIIGFPSFLKNAGYFTSNNSKTDYNTNKEKWIIENSWNENSDKAGWWGRKEGQPFFCVFNYMSSHQSRTMTWPWEQYKGQILDQLAPGNITKESEIEVPPFYRRSPEMRKYLSRVYNSLNFTDIEVGKLLGRLEADGLKENTIIFCFADHGEGIPKGKCNPIGLGYRVPFFIWFPEKYRHLSPWENGKATDELISFEDLAPTLLSLIGADIPSYMRGRPFLGGQRKVPRDYVFGSHNRSGEAPDVARTVTDGQFIYTRVFMPQYPVLKYHKYFDQAAITQAIRKDYKDGLLNEGQSELLEKRPIEYLYDLKNDPWEMHNLVGDGQYVDILDNMREAVYNNVLEISDVHFLPEYELDKISEETTAFDYRQDEKKYPLKRIFGTANLVGKDERVVGQQLSLLKDYNPIVRYWAAVGVHVQGENVREYKDAIFEGLDDEYPCARIEMAALAWELYQEPKAAQIFEEYLLHEGNAYLAWQVLQSWVYMGEGARSFLPLVKELKEYISVDETSPLNTSIVTNSIDVLLYNLEKEPLD